MLRSRRRAALQAWLERVETVLTDERDHGGPGLTSDQAGGAVPAELAPLIAAPGALGKHRLDLGA